MKATTSSLLLLIFIVILTGCTGTQIMVDPEPGALDLKGSGTCGNVAVKEMTPDKTYPPAGNLTPGFAAELERSGLFANVYYPSRPDDRVDLVINTKFNIIFDPNMGSGMTKSFLTGLTLFLLEPVFWYDYDYEFDGKIDLYEGKVLKRTYEAQTSAEMKMKFLSLGEAVTLESDTLTKAKASIYSQLVKKVGDYCAGK